MILGYQRLKNCEPGSLLRLQSGTYIIMSEYRHDNGKPMAYLSGSGENMATCDVDEWVAIIDYESIEVEVIEELDYPKQNNAKIGS